MPRPVLALIGIASEWSVRPFGHVLLAFGRVDFVEEEHLRLTLHADLVQNLVNGIELLLCMRMANIQNVQEQIRMRSGLLERRFKACDEVMRQVAHEPDRIAEEHLDAAIEFPGARFGVERRKQLVIRVGSGGGEGIEERALARIRIADDADREMMSDAFCDEASFSGLDAFDFVAEAADAFADEPAVDFQLLFARPACADARRCAAGDAFEVAPHLREPRIGILHLCQFHLQFCFVRLGAGGEDIENQFGAVENFDAAKARAIGFFVDDSFQGLDLSRG